MSDKITKDEAIQAMKDGKKVRHESMSKGDYIMLCEGKSHIYTDGHNLTNVEYYWKRREGIAWYLTDWELVTEDGEAKLTSSIQTPLNGMNEIDKVNLKEYNAEKK